MNATPQGDCCSVTSTTRAGWRITGLNMYFTSSWAEAPPQGPRPERRDHVNHVIISLNWNSFATSSTERKDHVIISLNWNSFATSSTERRDHVNHVIISLNWNSFATSSAPSTSSLRQWIPYPRFYTLALLCTTIHYSTGLSNTLEMNFYFAFTKLGIIVIGVTGVPEI